MTDVQVRGTTDPSEIAVVLAILSRDRTPEPPHGIGAWRAGRRAALTTSREQHTPRLRRTING